MEKYRLKQWYPNLHLVWSTTDNYEYDRKDNRMYNRTRWGTIAITAPYLHPDFWELIEEKRPLFVTEDEVEVSNPEDWVYLVNPLFEKIERYARNSNINISKEIVKVFYYESNADGYIWRNKLVFSYEDIYTYLKHSFLDIERMNLVEQHFRKLAKERSKE